MDSLGDNLIGAITDNTAANKKAWKTLEEKYPQRFFHGCVSHGLNLLVKHIFAAKKSTSGYPEGYPFEDLLLFTNNSKEVVSFFQNHHVPRATLRRALRAGKLNNLVQVAPTRWGTILGCFRSLRAADDVLNGLVSQRDFVVKGNANQREKHAEIKEIITDILLKTWTNASEFSSQLTCSLKYSKVTTRLAQTSTKLFWILKIRCI